MRFRTSLLCALLAALALNAGCKRASNQPSAADSGGTAATASATRGEAAATGEQAAQAAAATPAIESVGRFKLGTHYERLSPVQRTISNDITKVEVVEAFWYGCPHCYAADPHFERWLETKPDYVTFVRLPAVWNATLRFHARMFYTAKALGKGEEMHAAFFREIHENRNDLLSEDALKAFFARFGVSAADFEAAWNSPTVVNVDMPRAADYAERYGVDGVPKVIINGKYITGASEAGGYAELVELTRELAAAEHAQ